MDKGKVTARILLDILPLLIPLITYSFNTLNSDLAILVQLSIGLHLTCACSFYSISLHQSFNFHDHCHRYDIPQGFLLGSLLFMFFKTPFGSQCIDSFLDYHFYADDTKLFLSFDSPTFKLALQLFVSVFIVSNPGWLVTNSQWTLLRPNLFSWAQVINSTNLISSHQFSWMDFLLIAVYGGNLWLPHVISDIVLAMYKSVHSHGWCFCRIQSFILVPVITVFLWI